MSADEPTYRVDAGSVRRDLPLLALLGADLAFGLWAWPRMPQSVPVHWGLSGEPDRWGPSWVNAFLLPGLFAGLYLLLLFLPILDPRRRSYALFPETLRLFRWVLVLFGIGVHVAVTAQSLGAPVDVSQAVRVLLALLVVVLGNSLGRLRHNYFVGIRVPWTLASEEVWTRTHRAAGRLWVAGGLVQLVFAFAASGRAGNVLFASVFPVLVVVPVVHSWLLFRAFGSSGQAP